MLGVDRSGGEGFPLEGAGDPLAGSAPAGFEFGDGEAAVAAFAAEFGAVPFEEVAGGAADACRSGERAEAVFAALLLVGKRPAEGEQGEKNEREDLEEVGRERVWGGDRLRDGGAEEKREQKEEGELGGKEALAAEPEGRDDGGGGFRRAAMGDREGDKDDEYGGEGDAGEEAGEAKREGVQAGVEGDGEDGGEEAEGAEGAEAEQGGAAEELPGAMGAQPEGVSDETGGEAGCGPRAAVAGDVAFAQGLVALVPEFGLPRAVPVGAVGGGHDAAGDAEQGAVGWRKEKQGGVSHACFSGTRRARSG